ncbi:hypothetical protein HanXRQr2_Chr08g0361511 [Helianthus annuus]|uniref:Uncharacterized protein n=1 Tax=Helianthus annuus TaxID=4232 RepID=A0A251U9F4_HELAN|nr:hypothetical protein HanXRQr2_Chr08g0361501 [Helianthus annuus]KAF5797261.1 hypothetical protein HanXRQr2_Chr08g0361511 [Helianthus annuus]KAJ0903420.1 hypothetical protein HanPSC8_Chr08g0348821 [Helianthus annuus]KAJ0903421.1 hypothetical protein HanPSC8_Chr08g0348831 [Helianthus annuus]
MPLSFFLNCFSHVLKHEDILSYDYKEHTPYFISCLQLTALSKVKYGYLFI